MFRIKRFYSNFGRNLLKGKYPLFSYVLATNGAVYLSWKAGLISVGDLKRSFMLSRENVQKGRIYTLLSHSFTHVSLYHLLTNSIGLFFIGGNIERVFGRSVFLKVFFSGIVLGGLFQCAVSKEDKAMIGSSNGVSALLGYFVARFPRQKIFLFPFPFPISAWLLGTGYFYLNFKQYREDSQIGHAGHLAGFLSGLCL